MGKRLFVILAAVSVVAAACAPAPTGTRATTTPGVAEAPVRGGTAIVAIWQEPATLAAHYINQTISTVVVYGVLEGLVGTSNEGEYVPQLAAKVPTVGNGGAVVKGTKLDVTWELRPGIKWSDGQPLTSADIKYTWEIWMKDPKTNNRTGFSEIESIATPNELTAVVTYKSIYAPYPRNFDYIMPKHLLEKEADISKTDYTRRPLGTGPFKVTEFKAGDSITLEKNPNYRGAPEKPYLDKVVFKSVPSSEVAIAQLKAGEVHAMWNLTESQTPEIEKDPALALHVVQGPNIERIELNTAQNKENTDPNSVHPVLGDIEMRKALLYATPKQQLIDKLLFGKAKPGSSAVSQGWAAYREPQEGYDPKKANDTLDKAGWAKGTDGVRSKGGARASLTFTTTSGNQLRERVQQVLVDEYKAIGVEVKIQNGPSSVVLAGSCTGKDPRKLGTYDLMLYTTGPQIDPHSLLAPRYHSKQIPTAADCSGQNYTRIKDPQIDKALEDAATNLDQEKRKAAYQTVLKRVNEAYVTIWLYDRADLDARRVELRGWKPNTWGRVTWNVEDWFLKK